MRIFSQAFAGGFFGKIAGALFVAVCVLIGFGPDKWAEYLVSGAPQWFTPFWLRFALLALATVALSLLIAPYITNRWKWRGLTDDVPQQEAALGYLRQTDSELGSAIRDMAWHSAWGRWFAAQTLAARKLAVREDMLMQTAAYLVGDAILNGRLVVRGRPPGEMDYKPIDQTHWRSTALHMIPDQATLWRMILIPRGGAEISPDGMVVGRDEASAERTNQLGGYDSLIVNSVEFEMLWPQKDKATDTARRELLKAAKTAGADLTEIKKLSQE